MTCGSLSAVPGWDVWRVPARGNKDLLELRQDFYDQLVAHSDSPDRQTGPDNT